MVTTSSDAVTTQIARLLARQPAVGLAVGVVRDSELIHFRGHGVSDPATDAPITPDTGFRIASITKTLTAVAVMQPVEQGRATHAFRIDLPGDGEPIRVVFRQGLGGATDRLCPDIMPLVLRKQRMGRP